MQATGGRRGPALWWTPAPGGTPRRAHYLPEPRSPRMQNREGCLKEATAARGRDRQTVQTEGRQGQSDGRDRGTVETDRGDKMLSTVVLKASQACSSEETEKQPEVTERSRPWADTIATGREVGTASVPAAALSTRLGPAPSTPHPQQPPCSLRPVGPSTSRRQPALKKRTKGNDIPTRRPRPGPLGRLKGSR